MCRPKELGGRRCPQHTDPVKHTAYNARRRELYAAQKGTKKTPVETNVNLFPDFSKVRYSATYRDTPTFNAHVKESSAFEDNLNKALKEYEDKMYNGSSLDDESMTRLEELADEASVKQDELVDALNYYTTSGYDNTRHYFSDQRDVYGIPFTDHQKEEIEKRVKSLDECFEYAPKLKSPRLVYRGIRLSENTSTSAWVKEHFPVGGVVSQKNYMSTTRDPYLALTTFSEKPDELDDEDNAYNEDQESVVFEILSKQGVALGDRTSTFSEELEVFMPRDARFKVESVHFAQPVEIKLDSKDPFGRKEIRTIVRLVDVSEDAS